MKSITTQLIIFTFLCINLIHSHALASEPQVGKVIGKHIFGLARDVQHDPLMIGTEPLLYGASASATKIELDESVFRLDVFAGSIASVYISELDEDRETIVDTRSLPLGSVGGVHGATEQYKTLWNTAMFSENRLIDAASHDEFISEFKPYFKNNNELVKPYRYGWLNEIIVLDKEGSAKVIKTYAAGRLFASSFLIMPDKRTVYFHERASGNLYVFIAEEANSLAKGILYAVRNNSGLALEELGKSSALKMKFKLKKADFSKLFDKQEVRNSACNEGFTFIKTVYGEECLKVQKKNRKYVGQFEPIRMSAMKGVQPLLPEVESIRFDRNKNEIIVVDNRAQEKRYSLVNSAEYGSNFIIQ